MNLRILSPYSLDKEIGQYIIQNLTRLFDKALCITIVSVAHGHLNLNEPKVKYSVPLSH